MFQKVVLIDFCCSSLSELQPGRRIVLTVFESVQKRWANCWGASNMRLYAIVCGMVSRLGWNSCCCRTCTLWTGYLHAVVHVLWKSAVYYTWCATAEQLVNLKWYYFHIKIKRTVLCVSTVLSIPTFVLHTVHASIFVGWRVFWEDICALILDI